MRYLLMNYGVLGVIRLALDFIGTKIAFRKSRLIRFPIDIRGRSFIDFGSNLTTGRYCRLEVYPIEHKKGILKIGYRVCKCQRPSVSCCFCMLRSICTVRIQRNSGLIFPRY